MHEDTWGTFSDDFIFFFKICSFVSSFPPVCSNHESCICDIKFFDMFNLLNEVIKHRWCNVLENFLNPGRFLDSSV